MKIIALEEHTKDKTTGGKMFNVIQSNFPYFQQFLDPTKNIAVAHPDMVEIGEKRIKDMDKNGIDIAILSFSNPIQ